MVDLLRRFLAIMFITLFPAKQVRACLSTLHPTTLMYLHVYTGCTHTVHVHSYKANVQTDVQPKVSTVYKPCTHWTLGLYKGMYSSVCTTLADCVCVCTNFCTDTYAGCTYLLHVRTYYRYTNVKCNRNFVQVHELHVQICTVHTHIVMEVHTVCTSL